MRDCTKRQFAPAAEYMCPEHIRCKTNWPALRKRRFGPSFPSRSTLCAPCPSAPVGNAVCACHTCKATPQVGKCIGRPALGACIRTGWSRAQNPCSVVAQTERGWVAPAAVSAPLTTIARSVAVATAPLRRVISWDSSAACNSLPPCKESGREQKGASPARGIFAVANGTHSTLQLVLRSRVLPVV